MKSFFQLSEQARKHQVKKLREADANVAANPAAAGMANQQQQNATATPATAQNATAAPEMNDAQLVQGLAANWDKFVKDKQNGAALAKLKELQQAKPLATTLNNLPGEFKKLMAALGQQQQQQQKPAAPAPQAGSNTAGAAAGAAPTGAAPAAPQV